MHYIFRLKHYETLIKKHFFITVCRANLGHKIKRFILHT